MASKDARGQRPHSIRSVFRRQTFVAGGTLALLAMCGSLGAPPAAGQNPLRNTAPPAPVAGPAPAVPNATPSKPAAPAPITAVVNGEQITRQALGKECLARYGKETLETLINKQIIQQACQARGVTLTDKDLEEEILNVAKRFNLTVDRWLALLESERDVDAQQYRRDIIWPTLALRRLAAKQIVVTQEEYQKAFESEYGPKVKARLISVSSRAKADQALAKAKASPDNFPRLAKELSEDKASASAYGVIPPIRKNMGDANLERVAFNLKEGEISPILQVGNQYLILQCEKQLPRMLIASQQLPVIEKELKSRIQEHKMRVESAQVFQQLQAQSKIVNVFADPQLQAQYPGLAAAVNNQQITTLQLSDECIARHGNDVLDSEINRVLLTQELRRRQKQVQDQDIQREVARAADAYGYLKPDGTPDIDAWLRTVTQGEHATVELYVRDAVWPSVALKLLVGENVQVTDADLKKGFDSNFGERVEVLAIVLGNQRQAQTVWDMARNNPTDQFFGELARQYSIEPSSQANNGRVPPLREHGGQPVLEKEAFRLKAGELSGILAVGDKYVILRCLGRTRPVVKEFATVKGELYKDLHEKKLRLAMAKEFERLKDTSQIDNFLAGTTQSGKKATAPAATPASYQQPVAPAKGPAPPIKR